MKKMGLSGKYGGPLRSDALWMIRTTAYQDRARCRIGPSPWNASGIISHLFQRCVILALAVTCNSFPKKEGIAAL